MTQAAQEIRSIHSMLALVRHGACLKSHSGFLIGAVDGPLDWGTDFVINLNRLSDLNHGALAPVVPTP